MRNFTFRFNVKFCIVITEMTHMYVDMLVTSSNTNKKVVFSTET